MDLSQFSTDDLKALQTGDLSKVSTAGLKMLQAPSPGSADSLRQPDGSYRMSISGTSKSPNPATDFNGNSTFDNLAAGVGQSVVNTGRGVGQLVGSGLDQVSPGMSQRLGLPQSSDVAEARRMDAPLLNTGAGMTGSVLGNIGMMLAPGGALKGLGVAADAAGAGRAASALSGAGNALVAPTTLKGAATLGAATGAVQPVVDGGERLTNIGLGGAIGTAGNALSRVISPQTSPAVKALMGEGITPTPGHILGGGFKRAEEGLSSVPILGDAIKSAQGRAVADLNTAAFNRALKPIGETLPKGMKGREAVDYVGTTLGARYDALLPKLTTQLDGQAFTELQSLRGMMANGSIDPAKAKQFESILNNQLMAKFQTGSNGAPTITGETMKGIESDLGQMSSKFGRSLDPDQQMVGDALQEVQSILRGNVIRSNPEAAPELQKINEGWANFKRVQKAAAGIGADDGVFGAAQLQSAVKATDRSKDKAAFARGDALMQDLSEAGKSALGPKVPDSGTPYRSMLGLLAAGGAGAATGIVSPATASAALLGPAVYSRFGQNALATLLARRPDAAEPVANALRRLTPALTQPVLANMTTRQQ